MFIEPKNFRRLNLGANCLDAFELMAIRHRPLVEVILLNVKLPRYSCQSCKMNESESEKKRNNEIISKAVFKLFTILSTWQPTKELMLEFNVYSPSESDHWFKNYYFGSKHEDAASESLRQSPESTASWHDPEHGWVNGVRVKPPPRYSLLCDSFHIVILSYWKCYLGSMQLPALRCVDNVAVG